MKNLLILLLFVGVKIVFAQNSGTLNGRIVDQKTQQPLQGATIILKGTNIGTITDSDGYFILNNIPFQSYNVEASFLGYQT
ncbi:carboxypeptidase-like regulatory domain-containing protein, partial [Flavobacteriaceae bacterium]|nr:carboxypeptidase-like regulatory domain-containing protein [Flavobacteriaceae bacterium]